MLLLEKHLAKFGVKLGLERTQKLCEALGNPQDKLKVILVTGTNGKGSVVSYLSSILAEAGYKTGSYFSPHLVKYNERFKINGKEISEREFKKYEKEVLDLFKRGYEMTLFEALTAIAYKYFADKDCDFAVMEIGMGGTHDATNVASEAIAIITNVDLDHVEHLGNTIEEIAADKSGIIKNKNVITGASGSALDIIKKRAEERNANIKILNENIFARLKTANDKETIFDYIGENFYLNVSVPLLGRYQANNAALAIAAAEELGVEEKEIRKGLKKTKHAGRLQIIGKKPLVVLDAAHNVHGIKELVANLDLFEYEKLICVFTVMKDKDWKGMIGLLAPRCDLFIANQINDKRCEMAENIAEEAGKYTKAIAVKDVKKSLKEAKKKAKKKDLVLVCGSIYMLGELLK